ncbi:MAG: ABC transporter ATP-binding protein/permease, partial [Leptospira sp.]|nr:ABC transporter ATP-binding protein/permease [Leptospira sp.]
KVLGKGASHSSIEESKSKHETIFHLEEIVRNPEFYRSDSGFRFSEYRMTHLLENYLANRKLHFRIMFRQHLGLILLQILGSTFLLGVGGYLVLQKELSLGQLIAAELIFSRILDSLGKSGKYFENYYDLVAAIDKIGIVEDRISVSRESNQFHQFEKYKTISVQNLVLPGSMQSGKFNFSIPENRKILIEDESSSGTSLLFDCLTGLKQPESGRISIGNYNLNELNTEEIGKIFYLIRGNQILKVSLLDNLRGGNQEISSDGIRSILKRMDLLGLISRFENGLDEILYPLVSVNDEESNLIGIIRGYFSDSKVLLLDGTLDYLSMSGKAKIQKLISGKGFSKSILVS